MTCLSFLCSSCGCRLAVPSATVAVNPPAPTYENAIIVFLICVTSIILALIIKGVHASCCSKSKSSDEVAEDPVGEIYRKMYAPILDKKFDYLKKMADKELEKGGTEQTQKYLDALEEQLMKWAPKVFGEEGQPVSRDTHE